MIEHTLAVTGMHNALAETIRQQAAQQHATPWPTLSLSDFIAFNRTGDRAAYEKNYFDRRKRLAITGAAWLLDPGTENLTDLATALWQICQEPTWALPAHLFKSNNQGIKDAGALAPFLDLFSTETGQTVAYLLAAAQDQLPPELVDFVQYELHRRIFTPFMMNDWHWLYLHNNWAAVCAGSVGMAALSFYAPEDSQLRRILAKVDIGLQNFLVGFGPDGATEEGVDYWAYGFGYYLYFADQLARQTGDQRYLTDPRVAAIARFPYNITLFPGQYVKFGDTPLRSANIPSGLMSYCVQRLQAPLVTPLHYTGVDKNGRFAVLLHNLAWTDESLPVQLLPAETVLPDVAWHLTRRSGWAVAIKAGSNNVSHNHNDVGSWELITPTEAVVTELGSGEYTRDYFVEPARYHILEPRSLGHSVPLVNGQEQIAGPSTAGTLTVPAAGRSVIDFAAAYPVEAQLTRLTRTVTADDTQITLIDTADFKGPSNTLTEVLILPRKPVAVPGQPNVLQLGAQWQLIDTLGGDCTVEELTSHDHAGQPYQIFRLRLQYHFGDSGKVTLRLRSTL